jgi:hypothetical protein
MAEVFFSHSYRSEDAPVVRFFGDLMGAVGLRPSLDPPSDSLNDAKLRRHLMSTDAMVCVVTRRGDHASPYILHELNTCVAARKPLLVYVENTLRGPVAPIGVLQRRFSRRQLLRQYREHKHAMSVLKTYIGDEPAPKYQPYTGARRCLVLGTIPGDASVVEAVHSSISESGYEPLRAADRVRSGVLQPPDFYDAISSSDLAVVMSDVLTGEERFLQGVIAEAVVPAITLTTGSTAYDGSTPQEYREIRIERDAEEIAGIVSSQIDIFEQDLLDLPDVTAVDNYYRALLEIESSGSYDDVTRRIVVEAVHVGDQYNIRGQVGAVGPGAEAKDNVFEQLWRESSIGDEDLERLAEELARLRAALKDRATDPQGELEAATVGLAEQAAREDDRAAILRHLRAASQWALEVAKEIGVPVAQAAIRTALGLP